MTMAKICFPSGMEEMGYNKRNFDTLTEFRWVELKLLKDGFRKLNN